MSLWLTLAAVVCFALAACSGDNRNDGGRFNGAYGGVSGGVLR
jgi:hypothetical protein